MLPSSRRWGGETIPIPSVGEASLGLPQRYSAQADALGFCD